MSSAENPVIGHDGTITFPAFDLPLSMYMSEEAKRTFVRTFTSPGPIDLSSNAAFRASMDQYFWKPLLNGAMERYAVTVESQVVAGVSVNFVTPKNFASGAGDRILINLHGGSFEIGNGGLGGLVESVPIAAVSGIKVISVDYRQSPEHGFPAANEDVISVYSELLRTYEPQNIGIYGCSAGAILTSETIAWLLKEKFPLPGAIGLLCAGADPRYGGDSRRLAVDCANAAPPPALLPGYSDYFKDASPEDPLVTPVLSQEILKQFPPTLLISGTRAYDLSSAAYTHTQLVKLGIDAQLYIWDGMWHGFHYNTNMPESQEAFDIISKFFWKKLNVKQ